MGKSWAAGLRARSCRVGAEEGGPPPTACTGEWARGQSLGPLAGTKESPVRVTLVRSPQAPPPSPRLRE